MSKDYHHLTKEQRCQLYLLKKRGESQSTIASELQVHCSTVSRELSRNRGQRGYRYQQAHELALQRRGLSSQDRRKLVPAVITEIEKKLKLPWSPMQISGRLKRDRAAVCISHETIYKHI